MHTRIIHNVFCCGILLFSSAVIAEHQSVNSEDNHRHSYSQPRPSYIERDGVIYPTIKGTSTPDYGSKDRMIIRDGKVYDAIPGTTTPDYGTGRYFIQEDDE